MFVLLVDCVLFIFEMYMLNRFREQSSMQLNVKTKLSEQEKRAKYGIKYSVGNLIYLLICVILFNSFISAFE